MPESKPFKNLQITKIYISNKILTYFEGSTQLQESGGRGVFYLLKPQMVRPVLETGLKRTN